MMEVEFGYFTGASAYRAMDAKPLKDRFPPL